MTPSQRSHNHPRHTLFSSDNLPARSTHQGSTPGQKRLWSFLKFCDPSNTPGPFLLRDPGVWPEKTSGPGREDPGRGSLFPGAWWLPDVRPQAQCPLHGQAAPRPRENSSHSWPDKIRSRLQRPGIRNNNKIHGPDLRKRKVWFPDEKDRVRPSLPPWGGVPHTDQ